MYSNLSIVMVVCYVIIITMSTITIIHVFKHYKEYGSKFKVILNIAVVFFAGIIYSSLFIFSLFFFLSESINISLWKILTFVTYITLGLALIVYTLLKEIKKLLIIPCMVYSILFGLLIGILSSPYSVQIDINPSISAPIIITDLSNINYIYDLSTRIILIIYYSFVAIYTCYLTLSVYINARNKKSGQIFLLILFLFAIPQTFFVLYIQFPVQLYRELHFIILSTNFLGVAQLLILKPEMTLSLTNKIYAINIYHKSGILLYSYEFQYEAMRTETEIWGNILIGLNHIVGEFISETNQIDVLQTKNADIVVNYNNEYGFAVLILTNHKNIPLSNMLNEFVRDFKEKYEKELTEIQDLNNLIDASEFLGVENLIKKHFSIYF